ncbi:hypothetical protein HK405_002664, partial [Cladochytrium tenue]
RITALEKTRPLRPSKAGLAQHIMGVLPTPPDRGVLHDAMMAWHEHLPSKWKLFESLHVFSDTYDGERPPLCVDRAVFSEPVTFGITFYFLAGLATLHDPILSFTGGDASGGSPRTYRVGGRAFSSVQIAVLLHRALVHSIQSAQLFHGHAVLASPTSPPPRYPPSRHSPLPPPPPAQKQQQQQSTPEAEHEFWQWKNDPVNHTSRGKAGFGPSAPAPPPQVLGEITFAFAVYACAVNVVRAVAPEGFLASSSSSSGSDNSDRTDAVTAAAAAAYEGPDSARGVVGEVRDVLMPALMGVARLWRVGDVYYYRLREMLPGALAK